MRGLARQKARPHRADQSMRPALMCNVRTAYKLAAVLL